MLSFKDNFSKQAAIYAKFRPSYPPELFVFLSSLVKSHDLAWDCGTGNGQAVTGLAQHFNKVIATDPSAGQIKNALQHERVEYRVEKAEESSLDANSVDLLTVSNAMHWFDLGKFYPEVKRIVKPGGIIAAWAYGVPSVNPEVDEVVLHYHNVTLNNFWRHENRIVEKEYTTIPFPFEIISSPVFYYTKQTNLEGLCGYLETWSATQRFIDQKGMNPVGKVKEQLSTVWKEGEKELTWKLAMKVGRV